MIRALNLDSCFIPTAIPEIEFDLLTFSGGELHIKLNNNIKYSDIDRVVITHRVRSSNDMMSIFMVKNALEIEGVRCFDLIMPYIPYARQDRRCFKGEAFSLKVFSDILNQANFDKVHVFDSHSDVAPALINNCINHSNLVFVKDVLCDFKEKPILISPDAGANKKSNKLAIDLGLDLVKCDKVRDTKTGQLSGFEVFSESLLNRDCLIVDDICDGGGTFLGLASELKKKNAGNISLLTTHGIYSKGLEVLGDVFQKIYCTNSFSDINNINVRQIKISL